MADIAKYVTLTGLFTARIGDTGDPDHYPDRIPFDDGSVIRFVPQVPGTIVVFPSAAEHVKPRTIQGELRDGRLCYYALDELTGEGELVDGVTLMVSEDTRATTFWSYRVEFDLYLEGEQIDYAGYSIRVPDVPGPLDLAELTPVSGGGSPMVKGAPGPGIQSITAADGQITFTLENGDSTSVEFPDAIPGTPGRDVVSIRDTGGTGTATVTYSDGTTQLLPLPTGRQGDKGDPGVGVLSISNPVNGIATIRYTDGTTAPLQIPTGAKGDKGDTGAVEITGVVPTITVDSTAVTVGGKDVALAPLQAPSGLDANVVDANITYVTSASSAALNLPAGASPAGTLRTDVLIPADYRPKLQTYWPTNPAQIWTRFSGSGGWSAWRRLDATDSLSHSATPVSSLDAALAGTVVAFNSSTLNRPVDGTGVVITSGVLSAANKQQTAFTYGSSPQIWMRYLGSGGWASWSRMDAGAINPADFLGAPTPSAGGFKTVPLALTVGGSPAARSSSMTGGVRMPVRYGARVSRYRVHVRNINTRTGSPGSGTVSIPSMWIGRHAGNGMVTGANTLLTQNLTSTGADMVTPWITTPLEADTDYLITYQWDATEPTHAVVGGGWTTATKAEAASNAGTATRSPNLPLDVWIEAEVAPDTPVIAAFGDSLSSGVGATLPVYDSWLSQYCRSVKALPVHYTASGDTMQGWESSTHYKWTRWQQLSRPDAVVHAMGSNDVFGGADLTAMKARRQKSIDQLRTLVSPVVYSMTIMPRENTTGGPEDVRRAYNAWLKTFPDQGRDVFDVVGAVSLDDETLIDSIDADGIHLTTAGYLAMAQAITRPLAQSVRADPGPRLSALEYDSGVRNISGLLAGGWTGTAYLYRSGREVTLRLEGVTAPSSSSTSPLTFPAGFTPRPAGSYGSRDLLFTTANPPAIRRYDVTAAGVLTVRNHTAAEVLYGDVKFSTTDPIPTTLPGTPG